MRNQNTESSDFKRKNSDKLINKKVGHKGDYAIVKIGSPFITSVKTGAGTTGDPYIYTVDLSSDLTTDLASERTASETLKSDVALQKALSTMHRFNADSHVRDVSTISFSSLIKTNENSSIITNTEVANNTSIFYSVLNSHADNSSISNNNLFYIDINSTSLTPTSIKGLVDLEGYEIEVIDKSTNNIQFKITYNAIDVTNKHLLDESDLTVSFVIEW
tara:strand:- start:132 stop:785 length:654 start_codon:yes stop_codon:yes gene_type:complete